MIDKNGKIFGKISIIDIVIIICVIAAGVFFINRTGIFSPRSIVPTTGDKLRITFYQEEVNSFTANNVRINDPTTETLQNRSLGNVVEILIEPSASWTEDKDGNQIKGSKEGWNSVYITMETLGKLGPNGITIGGSKYYVGQFMTLRVGDSIFYGSISHAEEL